ncbi:hypothetical protein RHSIM_Rhsim11G0196600 [Rhododendron simsii]|uniref:LysM domain-containing protein n=1 Tax=Rhododendron simsii TaxID=118357 RepID=A0A834L8E4_RHOSS|nr:hypothetical protein RHSIM_Rhsim11G0196600 [Rhododendron simsii]
MGFFATALLAVFFAYAAAIASTVESFNCSGSSGTTCNGLVGYVPANATTLSNITTLFAIQNSLNSLLGANNFPLTTSPNQSVSAQQTVRISFPCICINGTGYPVNPPVHTVVSGDTMSDIATVVFSGLVTYQQIQAFNNVKDASMISIGQELKIPLPCSCDEVGGERVVHYGYAVESGDTVGGIAQEFNTTEETLLALNGLSSPKNLFANVPLDVPLKDYNVSRPKLHQLSGQHALLCNAKAQRAYTLETPQLQVVIAQLAHTLVTITKPSSQPSPHCPLAQFARPELELHSHVHPIGVAVSSPYVVRWLYIV